jgi:hypothetical protein
MPAKPSARASGTWTATLAVGGGLDRARDRDATRRGQLELDGLARRRRQPHRGLADPLAGAPHLGAGRLGGHDDRASDRRWRRWPPRRLVAIAAGADDEDRASAERDRGARRRHPSTRRRARRDRATGRGCRELLDQGPRRGRSRRRVLGQAAREDLIEAGRQDPPCRGGDRWHRGAEVLLHHRRQAGRGKRRPPGEQLEGHDREGVAIRGSHRPVGGPLLRSHVGRRAQPRALPRQGRDLVASGVRDQLGDPEIQDVGGRAIGGAREHDVVGLEIAVNDTLGVGGVDRRGDLPEEVEGDGGRHHPRLEPRPQRLPVQQIHHQVQSAVVEPTDREHVHDVGMIDLIDGAGLAQEPLGRRWPTRQLAAQDLDRHPLADQRVASGVDLAHPTGAERPLDHVVAGPGPRRQRGAVAAGRSVGQDRRRVATGRRGHRGAV